MKYSHTIILPLAVLITAALSLDTHARDKQTGTLVVNSMTNGAKVYIDGRLVGKTPIKKPLRLKPGKHKLKATRAGYGSVEYEFTIRHGRKTELEVDLLPHSGLVKFTCNIKGAEVYVDNQLIGHIPLVKDLVVGDHTVMIIMDGYNDYETEINVKAGQKHFVEAELTPFSDFSPEVLAIKKAQKEKQEREKRRQAELAAQAEKRKAEELTKVETVDDAPAWYSDLYKKWWVWAIAGAVVVTAVTIPLATSGGEQSGLHSHDDSPHTILDIRP